jgi:N,N-dimethylformamidase beta subunit-like, C-terminal
MATARYFRRTLLFVSLLGLVYAVLSGSNPRADDPEESDGRAERLLPTNRPTVEAAFPRESYSPGDLARLLFWTRGSQVSLQVFRAGTEGTPVRPQDAMLGTAVTATRRLGAVRPGRAVRIRIGEWPSGLYFAKLVARGGKVGYAPFVLRPRTLGENHVAVVLSTMTWQAYNFHDDDGNGTLDTWYAGQPHARLGRPFENRGVIPHYKHYEQPFLRWLISTSRNVDYLADADLDASSTTGRTLADAYDLIVFPGHHEYVTRHEFDVVTGFRNRGGNLMFLSANNFFYRTVKRGNVMTRTGRWRLAGRPEAALVGVQYFGNDAGRHQAPWTVRATSAGRWIFAGTNLQPGSTFGRGGIEADATTSSSPRGTQVISTIPNVFGTGRDAEMSYYELPNGAKVFAAGAFTLAGRAWMPGIEQVLENLWTRLADEEAPPGPVGNVSSPG